MRHATPSANTIDAATPSTTGQRRRMRLGLDMIFEKLAVGPDEVDDGETPASRAAVRMRASNAGDGSPLGAICASCFASSRSWGVNDVGSVAFIGSC
jgi:hypothetical protein